MAQIKIPDEQEQACIRINEMIAAVETLNYKLTKGLDIMHVMSGRKKELIPIEQDYIVKLNTVLYNQRDAYITKIQRISEKHAIELSDEDNAILNTTVWKPEKSRKSAAKTQASETDDAPESEEEATTLSEETNPLVEEAITEETSNPEAE